VHQSLLFSLWLLIRSFSHQSLVEFDFLLSLYLSNFFLSNSVPKLYFSFHCVRSVALGFYNDSLLSSAFVELILKSAPPQDFQISKVPPSAATEATPTPNKKPTWLFLLHIKQKNKKNKHKQKTTTKNPPGVLGGGVGGGGVGLVVWLVGGGLGGGGTHPHRIESVSPIFVTVPHSAFHPFSSLTGECILLAWRAVKMTFPQPPLLSFQFRQVYFAYCLDCFFVLFWPKERNPILYQVNNICSHFPIPIPISFMISFFLHNGSYREYLL